MEEIAEFKKSPQRQLKPGGQTLEVPEAGWLKSLRDRFNRVFKSEKKIGGHKISIRVHNNKHGSEEETKGMEVQFQNADIYIPEMFGWTQDYLNDLRRLSEGSVTPDDVLQKMQKMRAKDDPMYYSRDKSLFNFIYNSKKPITIIDVPEGHPFYYRQEEIRFPKIQVGSDFKHTLDSVRQYIKEFADLQKEREAYMLGQLEPKIRELISTYPQLGSKQEINALLSIGGAHFLFSNKLKNQYDTTKDINAAQRVFLYKEEAMIKYMFDKPVDDELVAKGVFETLLSKAHQKLFFTNDTVNDTRSIRRLVSRFSFYEMKDMFEAAHDLNEWADMFVQRLKKGLRIPKTKQELDEFLAKPISKNPRSATF